MSFIAPRDTLPKGTTVFEATICPAPASMLYAQTSCRLFSLPPELRNVIYTHAARPDIDHRPTKIYPHGVPHYVKYDDIHRLHLHVPSDALLLTCKRIRSEANGLFFDGLRRFFRDDDLPLEITNKWYWHSLRNFRAAVSFGVILQPHTVYELIVRCKSGSNTAELRFTNDVDPSCGGWRLTASTSSHTALFRHVRSAMKRVPSRENAASIVGNRMEDRMGMLGTSGPRSLEEEQFAAILPHFWKIAGDTKLVLFWDYVSHHREPSMASKVHTRN